MTNIIEIPVKAVREGVVSIRQSYDDETLQELGESLKKRQLYPIIVRPTNGGSYDLIIGSRRLRAAKKRRMKSIQATVIEDIDDKTALELALTENLQREDMTEFEEAWAVMRLVQDYKLGIQEAAKRIGKSEAFVRRRLQLLSLPEEVQKMLSTGELPMASVNPLTQLKSEKEQVEFARTAANHELSEGDLLTLIQEGLEEKKQSRGKRHSAPMNPTKAILRVKRLTKSLSGMIPAFSETRMGVKDKVNAEVALKALKREADKALKALSEN